MQRNGYWIYSLLGFLALYGLTFYPTIVLPYAFHDDFTMWMYEPQNNLYGNPQRNLLVVQGRPIASYIALFVSQFIHTIEDASYLRLSSVILCVLSATGLAFWLKWHKVDGGLAFLAGAGVFFVPGLQTVIIWSLCVPIVAVVFISILVGLVLLPVKTPPEVKGVLANKLNIYLICFAITLLVAGLYTYQSSVMVFLIFPLARVLVSSREMFIDSWKRLQVDMGVFVLSCMTYFLTNRYISLPYYYGLFPLAEEQMDKHRGYQFKLVSYWLIPRKISLFFKQLMPNALDLISYEFDLDWKVVSCVLIVILAGAVVAFYGGRRQPESMEYKVRFIPFYFGAIVMVLALFLMGSAPSLLAKGNFVGARIYIANSAIVFLLFCWAVFHLIGSFNPDLQIKLSRFVLGAVVASLCFIAQHNTFRSACLFSAEMKYLESQIVPHFHDNPRFHVIRARWSKGEAYTPSSFYWWDIPWMVRSIYVRHGMEANFNSSIVTNGTRVDPYEKASNLVIVDVNHITDMFYSVPTNPPPISLVHKNYLNFDVIKIGSQTSPFQYFAVTAGEYDIDKKSCPLDGCTKVYAGPTPESVIAWINNGAGETKVLVSSGLNGSFGDSKLMIDISPVWFTPSPPKYPEWIRIDYHAPKVVSGFRMQSPPPAKNGDPVHARMPRDFVFQGSQDGENWDDLLKVQGTVFTRGSEWKEWDFENSTAYKHYRLFITANNGHPKLIAIHDLKLKIVEKTP